MCGTVLVVVVCYVLLQSEVCAPLHMEGSMSFQMSGMDAACASEVAMWRILSLHASHEGCLCRALCADLARAFTTATLPGECSPLHSAQLQLFPLSIYIHTPNA